MTCTSKVGLEDAAPRRLCANAAMIELLESRLLLANYYVDTNLGHDVNNNGLSLNAAFKTIQRAADVAVAGDTVLIRGGTYRETVTPANSGTANARITFKPYNNESVTIDGTNSITGTWTQHSSNIYRIDLSNTFSSSLNQQQQLFVNGKMMTWAQTPNTVLGDLMRPTTFTVDAIVSNVSTLSSGLNPPSIFNNSNLGGGRRITFLDSESTDPAQKWANGGSIWVITRDAPSTAGGGWGFAVSGPIISYEAGRVTVDLPTDDGTGYAQPTLVAGSPYYLMDNFNALDAPGEYFIDKTNNRLYLWQPGGGNPATSEIAIKRRDFAFYLHNRSYITIEGINVFAATITTDSQVGTGSGGGKWAGIDGRGANTPIAPSTGVVLDGLRVSYPSYFNDQTGNMDWQRVGNSGVILSGNGHTLKNSIVQFSAGDGVSIWGKNHIVHNNVIHDVNYRVPAGSGITTRRNVDDLTITNNTIFNSTNCGISAINIRSTDPANPASIAYNRISTVGLQTWDVGGIRTVGRNANGTRIHHNIVSDIQGRLGAGIYLDSHGQFIVDHNVVYDARAALLAWNSSPNDFFNNTLIGNYQAVNGSNFPNGQFRNNLLHGRLDLTNGQGGNWTNNSSAGAARLDPHLGDHRLIAGSSAINAGTFVAPYTDNVIDGTPDIGAFEFGTPDWTAGSTIPLDFLPATNLQVTSLGGTTLRLDWTNNSSEPIYVERATIGGWHGQREFEVIAVLAPGTTTYTDTPSRVDVYYKLRAGRAPSTQTVSPSIARYGTPSGSGGTGEESPASAFDVNRDTKWYVSTNTGWLQYRFNGGAKQIVNMYVLTSGNDQSGRDPKNWTIQGSNDGSNWTTLDTRTNQTWSGRKVANTYSFSNTTPYAYYRLNVTANNGGSGLQLAELQLLPYHPVPAIPTSLVANTVSSTQINLSWTDNARSESSFRIERATDSAFTQNLTILTSGQNATSYNNTGLAAGTTYFYRIAATNAGGWSAYSDTVGATTPAAKVNVATGGTATASGGSGAEGPAAAFDNNNTTKWMTPSSTGWLQYQFGSGQRYIVTDYSITSANDMPTRDPKNWSLLGSNDGVNWVTLDTRTNQTWSSRFQTRAFTFSNSTAYNYYRLNITANNGNSYTQLAELRLEAASLVPASPSGLTATAASSSQINLSWTNNSNNETGFLIERATNSSFSQNLTSFSVDANVTSFSNSGLSAATTYYYRVWAINAGGWSSPSATAQAVTQSGQLVNVATGGTATASGGSGAEGPAAAFDSNNNTKWMTPNSSGWLQYQFGGGASHVVTQYSITSANDMPTRDPKNWSLMGSNDGTNWVTLDTRTNQTWSSRFETRTFTFSNSTAYGYYRLNITANNGNSYTQLAELKLFAPT